MPRKSKKPVRKQPHSPTGKVVGQVGQILLPMIAGIAATKADLTEWVYERGLTALHLLLREDAEEIAGLKGKHEKERTHNHWGSTNGELSFGGRRTANSGAAWQNCRRIVQCERVPSPCLAGGGS